MLNYEIEILEKKASKTYDAHGGVIVQRMTVYNQKSAIVAVGEATILKRIGDNDYLAEYNGVKCYAIFNPFAGRYFVDDVYGVIRSTPDRGER